MIVVVLVAEVVIVVGGGVTAVGIVGGVSRHHFDIHLRSLILHRFNSTLDIVEVS